MASQGWIAATRDEARKRILAASQRIGEALGVDPVVITEHREHDYNEAVQLDEIAKWAERLVAKFAPPAPGPEVVEAAPGTEEEAEQDDEVPAEEAPELTAGIPPKMAALMSGSKKRKGS